ncbi:MAG TPA: hypothetical protein DCF68_19415 [Cyanothece sp. UBA12306]|nr:hypothetical protein [Cyanothece sp. UBA12306]
MYTIAKWTVEDYHKMIEADILSDRKVELILGEILEMSPESPWHHFINLTVADYLRSLLGQQIVVSEAHPITLSDSEPEPDIAIVRSPNTLYINRHPYPEDIYWLIEISDSTLTKDLGIKKQTYALAKIPEYWVINLQQKVLKVFQNPQEDYYQIETEYTEGFICPLAFPSIKISLKKLLGYES